ncbi:DNA recombination protein RecF [Megasphaera cerevisiae DSM 20462]|uniref:DNA replication and repair protein RecF n=1 Tax=Megasphaera cerevisiae DSM 20462 TaxID=1122219 RepID=A0A0J6X0V5_9FIRM|nr:DNA replication/repair protein RecF [Megasphaera cerevisiae]KMO87792.1 DNA recombination protein RecF [Megasphaera cerevisiae DSM 20462]SJZ62563.1 DNA replication and repair protein RecF [Megasphaera cerevisiae DSM 20462]
MMIESIRLHQFRNYTDVKAKFPKAIVLLYGKNGQGKTNILEALYMGAVGKSYRGVADTDLIRWDCSEGSVILNFLRNGVNQQIKIILSKMAKKELWINETKVTQRELVGTLNEVLFSPEDLQLIKGSPSLRRRFMDMEISQVNQVYYKQLIQYNRAVSQRNLLLKKMKYDGMQSVEEWDRQIAVFAASIVKKRTEALHKISFLSGVIHRRLTGGKEKMTMSYVQSYFDSAKDKAEDIEDPAWYYKKLQENLQGDIYRMSTSVGPHRDDLNFFVDKADLKKYGSQGQQRTAVLSLKLSELEYIKSETGEYPVLLLDDVMSELDQSRRQAILDFVRNRIQTFITTTEPMIFEPMIGCRHICIEKGRIISDGGTAS